MKFTLGYIANNCGGKLSVSANSNREISGFFTDSRTPEAAHLFLALRGERVDGNSFVPELLEKGYAVMTDREENLSLGGDCIFVQDVRTALQTLSGNYRFNELKSVPIVGITGSVGKTTTKEMVSLALSSSLSVHKTLGNSNSQIGLPQTLLATPADIECAVVELGMSMPGEMERIAACAAPDISVITNIGFSHIENLGTREAICKEKLKIAVASSEDSVLILNGDEPLLRTESYGNKKVCFVSVESNKCDCYPVNVTETENGVEFTASVYGETVYVKLPVKGKHFVINSLFALAVASFLKLDLQKAANSLSQYESDGKRQFIYEKDGHTVISDCYNASPESMEAALSVLSTYKCRRIAVLGDMLELGHESVALHRLVGEYVSGRADILVTYGDLSRYIAETARNVSVYSFSTDESESMLAFLNDLINEGDAVLYKASNSIRLGRFIV